MTVVGYKCPACGAPLTFDSVSQKMKCDYCNTTFDVEEVKAYNEGLEKEKENPNDSFSWSNSAKDTEEYSQDGNTSNSNPYSEDDNLCSYRCSSCGGEIITDKTTSATSCPYCGNPAIMENQLSGVFKPDLVIPFKIEDKFAKDIYAKYASRKLLLPKLFKTQATMDKIKGIYIPFWLFDCTAHGRARFEATKVKHWSDSEYDYTKTDYYSVLREGNARFTKLPIDGSSKMPNEYMEAIEPFDYSTIKGFDKTYLSGYFAEKYDETCEACKPRANERIKNTTEKLLRDTVLGYTSCTTQSCNISTSDGSVSYALLPVWLLNLRFNNKLYSFAINGQTGKVVGKLPVSTAKVLIYFALSFIITFAIALLIIFFIL